MGLTLDEEAMLAGKRGPAVQRALHPQFEYGEFFQAEDFVPVTSVYLMAEIESMGKACLRWIGERAAAAPSQPTATRGASLSAIGVSWARAPSR